MNIHEENIEVDHPKEFSKFLIKLQPKTLCVLDITKSCQANDAATVHLISSVLVRCPAPSIVHGSQTQIVTLHTDGLLRLWNTDDGRCVLSSHQQLFSSKPLGMCAMAEYPGYLAVVGSQAEVFIVCVYTMQVKATTALQFKGFHSIQQSSATLGQLEIVDSLGQLLILVDQMHARNQNFSIKAGAPVWDQQQFNKYLKESDKFLSFNFKASGTVIAQSAGPERDIRRILNLQALLLMHKGAEGYVQVYQDVIQVQLYKTPFPKKMSVIEFPRDQHLIHSFVNQQHLYTVSNTCVLEIYLLQDLVHPHKPSDEELYVERVRLVQPVKRLDLISDCQVNDFGGVIKQNAWREITSDFKTQNEEVLHKLRQLKPTSFQFNQKVNFLYTICGKTMLTWNLSHTLEGKFGAAPLCINEVNPFKHQPINGSLISFNTILMNYCYRPNQFRFFYQDERVTACTTFEGSYLFGTNEGRVFQTPLFQEDDGKVQPSQLLAQHPSSVTQIYVAASTTVISCSDTQLMCTALKSEKPMAPMRSADLRRGRIDQIVSQRASKRRKSIGALTSCDQYFQYQVRKPSITSAVHSPQSIFKLQSLQTVSTYLRNEDPSSVEHPPDYYCVIGHKEITLLDKTFSTVIRICQLDVEVKAVLHDTKFQCLLIVDVDLNLQTYNLRSRQLGVKKRSAADLSRMLRLDSFVDQVMRCHGNYFQTQDRKDCNFLGIDHCDENLMKEHKIMKGKGIHSVLDYMMIGVKAPLIYSPQTCVQSGYSVALSELLKHKETLYTHKQSDESQHKILSLVLDFLSDLDHRTQSDSTTKNGVTHQRADVCGSPQSVLILNIRDMKDTMQQQLVRQRHLSALEISANHSSAEIEMINTSSNGNEVPAQLELDLEPSYFKERWPSQIFSLFHPFNLSEQLDISLKEYFDLSMPFLNFKLGIQGFDKSMSFCVSEEDQQYNREKNSISKAISLLRLSQHVRKTQRVFSTNEMIQADSNIFLRRFSNSEYWKISPYQSTIIPVVFFASMVCLVSLEENDINILMQDWLYQIQHIQLGTGFEMNALCVLPRTQQFSFSLLSHLLLNQDLDISSAAKDLILKPLICRNSLEVSQGSLTGYQQLYTQIVEWQTFVNETYDAMEEQNKQYQGLQQMLRQSQKQSGDAQPKQDPSLSNIFGELEVTSILNLAFFTYYTASCAPSQVRNMKLSQKVIDRCGKLVIIVIRDIVQQFKGSSEHVHLLTALMSPLQFSLKISPDNFKNQSLMEDVVKLLLFMFNYYKPQLSRDKTFKEVIVENYHLMRPYNPETFLKFQANEKLLKLGAAFTDQFLDLIKIHATTLADGPDHQRNALETLRYFINGYGQSLEKYLIKIVQILQRCLDPNDLSLRKNSHKYISVILSNLVKMFPMVAFHSTTQRLAVGTHEGPIGIYDVRTSAKIEIFEGHTAAVKCLAFDVKGKWLCSYSAGDLTLKLWKVGDSSFFSQLMGGNNRVANQIKLKPLLPRGSQSTRAQSGRIDLIEVESTPQMSEEATPDSKGRCKVAFKETDQKMVELQREDKGRETHRIVK